MKKKDVRRGRAKRQNKLLIPAFAQVARPWSRPSLFRRGRRVRACRRGGGVPSDKKK
jgi:hypothetical protein